MRLLPALCLLLAVSVSLAAPLDSATRRDIELHAAAVRSVVNGVASQHRHETHSWLAALADQFGARIATSQQLEQAVDWVANFAIQSGLDVHTESTDPLPRWVRGDASAVVTQPMLAGGREAPLQITALGRSIGTPLEGIEAPVVVVRDWDELENATGVAGSIVLLNPVYQGYGQTVQYRTQGASRAGARGAVAMLVRSIAPATLGQPHTGMGGDSPTPIPAAAVSHESADMLARMVARGDRPRVRLHLGAHEEAPIPGRIVVADLPGSDLAHEMVILSGHLDSWDIGTGSLDDGGGVAISLHALVLVKKLGLKPRRTLRFIAWNGEEYGMGSTRYWREHAHEAGNVTCAFESDEGVFQPAGLKLSAPVAAHAVARAVGQLLVDAGARGGAVESGGFGQDVADAARLGVPMASLANQANTWMRHRGVLAPGDARWQGDYFLYHHSAADSPSLFDPDQMDEALTTWASFALVFANMSTPLPRGEPADDAALLAALGSASTQAPPAVCGPDWEPPPSGDGSSGDHTGLRGISTVQLALASIASALIGAGGVWLLLHPGYIHEAGREARDDYVRRSPTVPVRNPRPARQEEALGSEGGHLQEPLLEAATT